MMPARRLPPLGARATSGVAVPRPGADRAEPGDGLRLLAEADGARVALVDGVTGASWTYVRLRDEVQRLARLFADAAGSVVLIHAHHDLATLVSLLACLEVGATALPVDAEVRPDVLAGLLVRYRPALVVGGHDLPEGYAPAPRDRTVGAIAGRSSFDAVTCHPDLALLLADAAGGAAGPRLVRLSADAVLAAANGAGAALGVSRGAVAAFGVPLHEAGAIAVAVAHLLAGATVVLPPARPGAPAFHRAVSAADTTTVVVTGRDLAAAAAVVAGDGAVASVGDVVVVGSGSDGDELRALWLVGDRTGRRVHVLHGRPENGGCGTVLAHEPARTRAGSIGRAVPGGRVEAIAGGDGLVFLGDNVMMGYAIGGADLVKGDELVGRLYADVRGSVDIDGYVWPTDATARTTA